MNTTFESFNKYRYNKQELIKGMPGSIEYADKWAIAVNVATKDGIKFSSYDVVTSIYNNLIKKIPTHNTDNPQYTFYKKKFDLVSWGNNNSKRKFILDLLNQLKRTHKLSQKQWYFLKKSLR